MIRRFFRYIRRQSKPVRDRYAFSFAVLFTGGVSAFWLMSGSAFNFSTPEVAESEKSNSPFSTLIKQSKEQLASLKDSFQDIESQDGVNNEDDSDLSSATSTAQVDPTKLILTTEDLDITSKKEQENIDLSYSSSTSEVKTAPVYQEVMIVTTPSVKLKTNLASSSDIVKDATSSSTVSR
jgi:hypothetical protein